MQPGGAQFRTSAFWPEQRCIDTTGPDAQVLKALFFQHPGSRRRRTKGKRTLAVDEAIVCPHGSGEDGNAEVSAVSGHVGMIGRDDRFIEETRSRQARRSKHHGVDQVYDIGLKLVQATYEKRPEEVKFEFRVERQGKASRTHNLCLPACHFQAQAKGRGARWPVSILRDAQGYASHRPASVESSL